MQDVKRGDYVIATEKVNNISKNSVGLIKEISNEKVTVFFIGKNKTMKLNKKDITFLDITKTGKPYDKKICNICHILKNMNEFAINQTDAKGRKTTRPSCKVCRIAIEGDHFISSEKKKMDAIRPKDVFICPICNKKSIADVTANLVRDHNHITGKGREWICDSCNTGLGRFRDDIKLLEKAIEYLKKYS